MKFKTLDEVIERANDTNYGLAAGILTKNLDNALVFVNAIEAGTVWVNQYLVGGPQLPFGGYKESGIGREMYVGIFYLIHLVEIFIHAASVLPKNAQNFNTPKE